MGLNSTKTNRTVKEGEEERKVRMKKKHKLEKGKITKQEKIPKKSK